MLPGKRLYPLFPAILFSILTASSASVANDRPVIGIVAEDYYGSVPGKTTYIAASYVKWVESAGARVLPIFINQTAEYYDRVLDLVNGVIFPGSLIGGAWSDSFTVVDHSIDCAKSRLGELFHDTDSIAGGAVHIDKDTGYGISGRLIYKKILKRNLIDNLPLWGTCLGMELVIYNHLDGKDPRTR